jgi:hypothetical protein
MPISWRAWSGRSYERSCAARAEIRSRLPNCSGSTGTRCESGSGTSGYPCPGRPRHPGRKHGRAPERSIRLVRSLGPPGHVRRSCRGRRLAKARPPVVLSADPPSTSTWRVRPPRSPRLSMSPYRGDRGAGRCSRHGSRPSPEAHRRPDHAIGALTLTNAGSPTAPERRRPGAPAGDRSADATWKSG